MNREKKIIQTNEHEMNNDKSHCESLAFSHTCADQQCNQPHQIFMMCPKLIILSLNFCAKAKEKPFIKRFYLVSLTTYKQIEK